jgi:hypothetical protein
MPRTRPNPYSGKHGTLLRIGLSDPKAAPAAKPSEKAKDPSASPGNNGRDSNRRGDGPPSTSYARGSKEKAIQIASSPQLLEEAIQTHDKNIYSAGHSKVRLNQEALWDDISFAASEQRPIQLTADILCRNISVLRAARFRSAMAVASVAKFRHIELEHPWTPALQRQWDKSQRAVHRGMGPAAHAAPFPLGGSIRAKRNGKCHSSGWPFASSTRDQNRMLVAPPGDRVGKLLH